MEDTENILKRFSQEVDEKFARHIGVISEAFEHKTQLLAEGISIVQQKLDDQGKTLFKIQNILEEHSVAILSLQDKVSNIESRLDAHAEAIAAIKEDTEILKTDMSFIKNSLQRKVDIDQFMVLEKRVAVLESKVRA